MDFSLRYCRMCLKAKELQEYWQAIEWKEEDGRKQNLKIVKKSGDFFYIHSRRVEDLSERAYLRGYPNNACLLAGSTYHLCGEIKEDDDIKFKVNGIANMGRGGFWYEQGVLKDKDFYDICVWLPRVDQILSLFEEDVCLLKEKEETYEQSILKLYMKYKYHKEWIEGDWRGY